MHIDSHLSLDVFHLWVLNSTEVWRSDTLIHQISEDSKIIRIVSWRYREMRITENDCPWVCLCSCLVCASLPLPLYLTCFLNSLSPHLHFSNLFFFLLLSLPAFLLSFLLSDVDVAYWLINSVQNNTLWSACIMADSINNYCSSEFNNALFNGWMNDL